MDDLPSDREIELEKQAELYRKALEDVAEVLRVPAAEYVPAIRDAWSIIDRALDSEVVLVARMSLD